MSSPHLHCGRDLRYRALGKTDAGYGWLRVQLDQPGMPLLRCLGPRRAERVAVAMFGPSGLDMLICRNECIAYGRIYVQSCIIFHDPASVLTSPAVIAAQPFHVDAYSKKG